MSQIVRAYQKLAYLIFIPYVLIFLSYIGTGYFFSISATFQSLNHNIVFFICLIAILLIYIFIRHTAYLIHISRQLRGFGAFLWLASCVILFLGSGYGFLTSSMLFFEGPVVAREDVVAATPQIAKLDEIARANLPLPEYEHLKTQTALLRGQLHAEILNFSQGYCGVGPAAKQIISSLTNLLPDVKVISGTDKDHSCDNRERLTTMVAAYDKSIADAMASSPLITTYHIPDRQQILNDVVPTLEHDLGVLRDLQVKLAGVPSFLSNISLYHQTVETLEASSLNYSKTYEKVSRFVNLSGTGLPPNLHVNDLEEIVSGVQVLNTLMSRGDHLTTWLYVLVAFGCDILAAFSASTVFLEYQNVHGKDGSLNHGPIPARYLWVPEAPPTGLYEDPDHDRRNRQ